MRETLHELGEMRAVLENELFFTDGELTPDLQRRWDDVQWKSDDKLYLAGVWVCEQRALVRAIEHEEERLAERKRSFLNAIERRKKFVHYQMRRFGKRSIEGPICTVLLQTNATDTVEVIEADPVLAAQPDLFATRNRGGFSTRTGTRRVRGQHVRIR